jgi:RsiW-degrading membrane proteinase PrsW (M82 family)
VVVGVVAVAVVLLLMPFVRDFVDLFASDADGADNTVSVLVEWLLGGVLAFLLYSAVVAAPGVVERLVSRRSHGR